LREVVSASIFGKTMLLVRVILLSFPRNTL
jgi:hypothetical protein